MDESPAPRHTRASVEDDGLTALMRLEASGVVDGRRGTLRFWELDDPPVFLVAGTGSIGPASVKRELVHAEAFGARHPSGWTYVVDTEGVRMANPLILRWLRRIHALPNIERYIVVAPSRMLRLLGRLASPFVGSDHVVRDKAEAWRLIVGRG